MADDFAWALPRLKNGGKVKRSAWAGSPEWITVPATGDRRIESEGGEQYTLTEGDILATDWEPSK